MSLYLLLFEHYEDDMDSTMNIKEIAIKYNLTDSDLLNDLKQFGKDKFDEGFNYARQRNDWIPCAERLPSEMGSYLVSTTNMGVMFVHFERGKFVSDFGELDVTAWQPVEDFRDKQADCGDVPQLNK